MKKFVEFLNHPLLHLVIGLLLYLWIGGGIWHLGETFDPVSAFLGGLTVIAMDNRVPPFRLRRPLLNADRRQQWEIQRSNYEISHGSVVPRTLIYFNRSNYNTRIFKEMLENA